MTATPLNCRRLALVFCRLRAQHGTLAIVLLLAVFTASCAPLGANSPQSTGSAPHDILISTGLPSGTQGSLYDAVLSVTGGTAPYRFSISGGTLPPGLTLDANTGLISGRPTVARRYSFVVSVTDLSTKRGERQLSLTVGRSQRRFPNVNLTVSPAVTTVPSGQTEQFTSSFRGTSNTAVEWTTTLGKISSSGLFTPPSVTGTQIAVVKATSVADPSAQATATVTITPAGIAPPPTYQPKPPSPSSSADNRYCSSGDQAHFGLMDSPANLPQRCIYTALSGTPSDGRKIPVRAGEDVNTVLQNASCGDVILLQAGATYKGPVTLPAKNCDAQHWITLRTSALDSSLPPEGTRITPCYAGISSLPARPAYSCPVLQNVLAKIQIAKGAGAITVAAGANYYRVIGLEITRQRGTGGVFGLVRIVAAADHLIFDRLWVHGTALDDTTRGVFLGAGTNIAVIDSYLNDFHCTAVTGSCIDSQAINGGNSFLPSGPYKIVNNFLEAAAENILWGGADGSTVPADIEIRRNHMFKPLSWMPASPNFIGTKFIAKNLFEIKNAERLLLEANVMDNSWGGFSQVGWGIVLTPRGSWAANRDITIRYNEISHIGAGFAICASPQQLPNGQKVDSLASERVSIHDVIVEDMSASAYNGSGIGFQISSGFVVNKPLNNVTINHVTMLTDPSKTLLVVGADNRNPMRPFDIVFTNNIAVAGGTPVWSMGGVYMGTCARTGQPLITFNQCWSSYSVTNNAIVAPPSSQGSWPNGNFFASGETALGFTNFTNGAAGNYQLISSSPYAQLGIPDRTALGADISTLSTSIQGVQ
jgi:hypothetical protein